MAGNSKEVAQAKKVKAIYKALAEIATKTKDDSYWNNDRTVKLEKVSEMAGVTVTVLEIRDLTKNFSRDNPTLTDNIKISDGVQGMTDDEKDDNDLDAKLKDAQKELEEANQTLAEAENEKLEAQRKVDSILTRIEIDNIGRNTDAEDLKRYQESQLEIRRQKLGMMKAESVPDKDKPSEVKSETKTETTK